MTSCTFSPPLFWVLMALIASGPDVMMCWLAQSTAAAWPTRSKWPVSLSPPYSWEQSTDLPEPQSLLATHDPRWGAFYFFKHHNIYFHKCNYLSQRDICWFCFSVCLLAGKWENYWMDGPWMYKDNWRVSVLEAGTRSYLSKSRHSIMAYNS